MSCFLKFWYYTMMDHYWYVFYMFANTRLGDISRLQVGFKMYKSNIRNSEIMHLKWVGIFYRIDTGASNRLYQWAIRLYYMVSRNNFVYCKVDFENFLCPRVGKFEENHPLVKYSNLAFWAWRSCWTCLKVIYSNINGRIWNLFLKLPSSYDVRKWPERARLARTFRD